ncbi:Calcineurin-like phosphoesterase [Mariniphaga anaerophila]|uniref:Calcineurin-like phosphoesterase n=1 Tax=Mariniphaga anaerophila TaxID=1484053 RepID=A0A1M4XWK0_9BACT|nr:metallophosphoesterase [Mariniphaga anaerophila]SHE97849.1 Calcineurin-like phosphoesterase [Mariniphaga anaerophila]
MYDIIGDVHGHAQLLKKLLLELGYEKTDGGYSHPDRKAVFVGDFINRGPQIRKTIRIIRKMVESGNALAVLGNHEVNIIISYLKDKKGNPLVKPPLKNFLSGLKTFNEFADAPEEWQSNLRWLRTLPLFLDLDGIRVVHACWSDLAVEFVKNNLPPGKIKKEVFKKIYKSPGSELAKNIWLLTKGLQFKMPGDLKIINNKGVSPRSFRMRWWEDPKGKTFEELSFESKFSLPEYTVPPEITPESLPYPPDAPIVFFGHYCRGNGPHIIKANICCLDGCIVGKKTLLAYRWNGETSLNPENLVKIQKISPSKTL